MELCFTAGAVSGGTPTLEVAALVPVGKHPLQILRCECCGYWRKVPTALQRLSSRQPGSSCTSRRRGISLSIRARWPTVPLLANWETLQETTLARSRRIVEAMFSSERLAAPCRRIRRSTRRLFPGGRLCPFYILADVVQATTASQCAAESNPVGTGRQPLEA